MFNAQCSPDNYRDQCSMKNPKLNDIALKLAYQYKDPPV